MLTRLQSEEQIANFLKPIFILDRFASAFSERTELNKTQLQLLSKLRWDSFNNYLDWLIAKEFLQCRKEGRVEIYSLTEQGRITFNILATFIDCLK